ncbi:MAG: HEAT repeat domain-containing protein [Planctomycetota bacterium]
MNAKHRTRVGAAIVATLLIGYAVSQLPSSSPRATSDVAGTTTTTAPHAPTAVLPTQSAPVTIPAASIARPALAGYEAGDRLRYDFRQRTRLGGSLSPEVAADESTTGAADTLQFENETTGVLEVRVYAVETAAALLGLSLDSAAVTIRNAEIPSGAPHDRLAQDLSREVLVSLTATGAVSGVMFEPGLTPDADNLWRDLLARWQLVRSGAPGDSEWAHHESDPTGKCWVSYHSEALPNQERVTKTRVEYVETFSRAPSSTPARTESWEEIEFLVERIPTSIGGEGRVEIELGMTVQTITCDIDWAMTLSESTRDERLIALAAERRDRALALPRSVLSDVRVPAKNREQAPLTRDELLALLAELEANIATNGVRNPEAVGVIAALAAGVRANDLTVTLIAAALERSDLPEGMAAALFAALSAGGTPSAQNLLLEVVTATTHNDRDRRAALMSLAQVAAPLAEIDDELKALVDAAGPLANSALLVLGAVGDKMRLSDPTRFAAAQQYLLRRIAEPHARPAARATAVRALANLGLPTTEPALVDLYATGDARVRRATLECFQRTFDEPATRLLARAAHEDSDPELRTFALQLLATEGRPGQVAALVEIVIGDASEAVRYGALHYLGDHVGRSSELRDLVSWIADSEPLASLRQLARELLDRG